MIDKRRSGKVLRPKDFTVKQLLIASGISRRIKKQHIMRLVGVTLTYIIRLEDDVDFKRLIATMDALPPDSDHKEFHGISTLYSDAGRFIYNYSTRMLAGDLVDELGDD